MRTIAQKIKSTNDQLKELNRRRELQVMKKRSLYDQLEMTEQKITMIDGRIQDWERELSILEAQQKELDSIIRGGSENDAANDMECS